MTGVIWIFLLLLSLSAAVVTGRWDEAGGAILRAGQEAITLTISLGATMIMWGGMLEILHETGDMKRLARGLRRVMAPLFGGLRNEGCCEAIGLNLSANMLGLGNAATPAGIRAAKLLAAQGEQGMQALAAFLVLNNAGVQLLPTTVISLRAAAGSADPAGVWLPSAACGIVSAATGLIALYLINRAGKRGRG